VGVLLFNGEGVHVQTLLFYLLITFPALKTFFSPLEEMGDFKPDPSFFNEESKCTCFSKWDLLRVLKKYREFLFRVAKCLRELK